MRARIRMEGLAPLLLLSALGCSEGNRGGGPMAPSDIAPMRGPATLLSVSPAGDTAGVPVGGPIRLGFGAAMAEGMEQFVDLHLGDPGGPTVPLHCDWSGDRTVLTCTPEEPLRRRTTYWLHLGGGLTTRGGFPVDLGAHGPGYGGQWMGGGMPWGSHAGQPWGALGSGWHHGSHFGMAFPFTTG